MRGRRRLRRRCGELGRPGGAEPRPVRQAGRAGGPGGRRSRRPCRSTSSSGSRAAPTIEVRSGQRGRRLRGATGTWRRSPCRPGHRADEEVADELAVRLHRRLAAHRLARRGGASATTRASWSPVRTWLRPRPARWPLRPGAVRPRDQRARSVRGRRRTAGLDEAGGVRRRRGRDVGLPRAPLPGDDLMRRRGPAAARALRRAERRPARRAAGRRRRGRASSPARRCSARASTPTTGGCWSTGAIELVAAVGREDDRRRRGWTSPAAGRAGSGPGTSTASTSPPAAASTPGRVLRVPAEVLRDAVATRGSRSAST